MLGIKFIAQLAIAAGAIALGLVVFAGTWFNIVVVLSLFLLIMKGVRTAAYFGIIGCILYEIVSPFPSYTVVIAWAVTLILMHYFLIHYVTHRSLLGVIATALLGTAGFEGMLLITSRIGIYIEQGFSPAITTLYAYAVLERVIASTVLITLIVFLVQQFSPRARGTILIRGPA